MGQPRGRRNSHRPHRIASTLARSATNRSGLSAGKHAHGRQPHQRIAVAQRFARGPSRSRSTDNWPADRSPSPARSLASHCGRPDPAAASRLPALPSRPASIAGRPMRLALRLVSPYHFLTASAAHCGRFVRLRVAIVAGVRRAQLDRQIGPRHAEAVIAPLVDHHVRPRRHVALDALAPRPSRPRDDDGPAYRTSPGCALVTLRAQAVARELQLQRMRIVAIGAAHVVRVHLALQERTVLVHLVENLPVGLVQRLRPAATGS